MRNRQTFRTRVGHTFSKCPMCGNPTVKMFAPHCSSRCVEEQVDQNIMDEQDRRQAQEDRNEGYV